MARKSQTFTATFHHAERIGCSTNGNPTWLLHTSEGTFRTQSDTGLGYEVANHDRTPERGGWRDREVRFTATPAGRVWDMKLVDA
jgi:hypothetical protein